MRLTKVDAMTGMTKSSSRRFNTLSSSDNGEGFLRSSCLDNCLSSLSSCKFRCSSLNPCEDERLVLSFGRLECFVSVSSSVSKHSEYVSALEASWKYFINI